MILKFCNDHLFSQIPFSKFLLTHKGRIQDSQDRVNLNNVHSISFTVSDGIDGPFSLEIDYIGVLYDENFTEEFAYEMYEGRPFEN